MVMSTSGDAAVRLRTAFMLFDTAVDLMRQNLRRRLPDASEDELEAELARWLCGHIEHPRRYFRPRPLEME